MRVVGICGRGIEGCGQTKYMIETKKALEYSGHVCDLIVSTDHSFPRKNAHEIDSKYVGKFENESFVDHMIDEANKYDLAILFSIPDIKFSEKCKTGFMRFLNSLNIKIIYIMVDHAMGSIRRNINVEEICEKVDMILVHSLTGVMANYVKSLGLKTPVDYLYTSRNFDEMRDKFWKPVDQINMKSVKWIGRSAFWKKPLLFVDFSAKKLNPAGYVTTMEGLEKSMAFATMFFIDSSQKNGIIPGIDLSQYASPKFDEFTSDNTYVLGAYVFNECMERLSKSGFGADLYTLKPERYGRSLEQCHNDIVACGCIPIFSKHFGENCLTLENKRWIDACPEIVWLDEDNYDEAFEKMERYRNDPVLFDETREKIYEFFKTQGDISVISKKFDEILAKAQALPFKKRTHKTQMKLW